MKKRSSIVWRLAIGLSLGTALLWIGAAAIALSVLHAELTEAFDQTLKQSALRLLPLAIHDVGEPDEHKEYKVTSLPAQDQFFSYFVSDPSGRPTLMSDDVPPELLHDSIPAGYSDLGGHRVLSISDGKSGFRIVLMENSTHRADAFVEAIGALFWPLAGLIPLIAIGIWAAVRLAMRPVELLRREIAERGGHNLSDMSSEGHPAELAPIVDEVASLLRRLRAALDAERAFAASSAHELRTPIAGALAQTQQLALELEGEKGGARVKEIERALRKLAELSEKLLQLARLDAGFSNADSETNLVPIVKLVVRDAHGGADEPGKVRLKIAPDTRLLVRINSDAFAIALSNLIQNAIKHGPKNGVVEVLAGPESAIRVVNGGPTIAPELLEKLGERFVRGQTKAHGSGLGLSIARAIMEQTGGTLTLYSPARGHDDGFEAELAWQD